MASKRSTRRTFIRHMGWAGASLPALLPALVRAASPNGKLNHASIGVGGMGWNDLHNFAGHPNVRMAALCDVDANSLARAKSEKGPEAATYSDWRQLLDKEGDKIDSCNVTVPDHMHAIIALNALRRHKHVYLQKPMCHDVAEVRALTLEAAKQPGLVTQIGTQHASGMGNRLAVEYVRRGLIGKIKRAVLCSNRPDAIAEYRLEGPRPTQGEPVPPNLDWDLWIGTAPQRPYARNIYHPSKWRAWLDFGTGWLGDIGCHIFSAPWKALDLNAPKTIAARVQESWADSAARRADNWPQSDHITWVFPENERTDGPLTLEWYDGLFFPPQDVQKMAQTDNYPAEAAMFIGTEGSLLLPNGSGPQLLPRDKFKDNTPRIQLAPQDHYHNFVNAIFGKEKIESPFSMAGPMSETVLLGAVAIRTPGQTLEWDAANLAFPNQPSANPLLRRNYRDGWRCEGLG